MVGISGSKQCHTIIDQMAWPDSSLCVVQWWELAGANKMRHKIIDQMAWPDLSQCVVQWWELVGSNKVCDKIIDQVTCPGQLLRVVARPSPGAMHCSVMISTTDHPCWPCISLILGECFQDDIIIQDGMHCREGFLLLTTLFWPCKLWFLASIFKMASECLSLCASLYSASSKCSLEVMLSGWQDAKIQLLTSWVWLLVEVAGVFFSRISFLCWLVSVPPLCYCSYSVTAVACKRSGSFCQQCRWQVTAKHVHALTMWTYTSV